jgi:hypothetical protein
MNRQSSIKAIAAAAVVLGAFGVATSAHARSDVVLSIGLGAPVYAAPVYTPAPVYVEPAPVYYEPAPVYYYNQPRVVYTQPVVRWDSHRRYGHGYRAYGDWDRDGVPNRYDRAPGNPYRH